MRPAIAFVLLTVSTVASAQGVDVGISGIGLLSIQPIDDAYVGSPYLSEGIGGLGPGFGAGLSVIATSGLVVAGEFTTARFEQEQSGRLVGGPFPNDGIPKTTRLNDSVLSVLAGYATAPGGTRVQFLGGVGFRLDEPTVDGEPREGSEFDTVNPLVITGGADLLQRLGSRASLVIGGRYLYVPREETHRYLGIGAHLIRIGAGVRIRIN